MKRSYIVMTGYAAENAAARLAADNRASLEKYYSFAYIDRMIRTGSGDTTENISLPAVYPSIGGGVYRALWNICEDFGCGIRVDIRDIPIKQETIEICNHLDIDPYTLDDESINLVVTSEPQPVTGLLTAKGLNAAPIGYLTEERTRMIVIGDNVRYLNRPQIQEENT